MKRINTGIPIGIMVGDIYECMYDISCRDGSTLPNGSTVTVLEKTGFIPYGEVGPDKNWLCKAANGNTVWSTLESCIERKLLKKVSSNGTD